ncbi:uncharacterized protein LOC110025490 [Phalaenopsis equestris]|uniref:uncharacterized protein LOC110025490 n=1 Tax=Phalaenopsis equestris TaxID=78828 RepID=UPI0009E3ED02|nr:uncharacterized protein LOC110025490 [Phalaenopsis equestris]
MEAMEEVVIIGAGISGLATALGLHRKGIRSVILESSESLRASGFALTLWDNAWRALDALGVANSLRQNHLSLQRIVVNSADSGAMTAQIPFSAAGKRGEREVRCLRRSFLLEALAKELPPGTIRYSSRVVGIEEDGYLMLLHLADGSTLKTKILLGCDGVNSVVSKWLGLSKPYFSGRSATRGFAVFPQGYGFKHEMLQFFGEGFRFGLLTCDEKCIYWFFTWTPTNQDKEAEENASIMKELILSKMRKTKLPEEIIAVIEKSEISEPVSSPLRYRWPFDLLTGNISKGNVSVAGDALHPMTPDIGQGGCSALEDAIVLARSLGEALLAGKHCKTEEEEYGIIEKSLGKYARMRRWRSFDLIATAYLVGFIQQNEGVVIRFLRDKCLSGILSWIMLKKVEFDCGRI